MIITPNNKKILIDGGGRLKEENYDVGKNILLPYLLDRGVIQIDYLMISHFDSDHYQGLVEVLSNISVKNVILSRQMQISENYQEFLNIARKRKVSLIFVEAGDKLKIDKDIYFSILWPKTKQMQENVLNNNSIVAKLQYRDFSCLFTGDIEKIAEEEILKEYANTTELKSNILKVAHHGSKTSSTLNFLQKVSPKISLIGVGENNTFGHPNFEVILRLKELRKQNLLHKRKRRNNNNC